MPFVYSGNALDGLTQAIAKDRLSQYLTQANGNSMLALMLYERNTRLSQGIYGVLQPLEIAFRNAIHRVMSTDTGRSNWYKYGLSYREAEAVKSAKNNLVRWHKTVTPGRMVAELTFGFWLRLLDTSYEKSLWVPHLYKVFPNLNKPDRATVFNRLYSIKTLRNRVAHHEPIIFRNLGQDYLDTVETIEWICHTTAAWVRTTNTFQRDFSN